MHKILGITLLLGASCSVALAVGGITAPEIDATTGVTALALLAGAVLVIRERRRKS